MERRRLWAPGKQAGEGEPSSCGIHKLAEAQGPVCQPGTGKGRARGRDAPGPCRDGNHSGPQPPSLVVKPLSAGADGRTGAASTGAPSVGLVTSQVSPPSGSPASSPQGPGKGAEKRAGSWAARKTTLGKRSLTGAGCPSLPEPVSAAPGLRQLLLTPFPLWLGYTKGTGPCGSGTGDRSRPLPLRHPRRWRQGGCGSGTGPFVLPTSAPRHRGPPSQAGARARPSRRATGRGEPRSPSSPRSPRPHHDGRSGIVYLK